MVAINQTFWFIQVKERVQTRHNTTFGKIVKRALRWKRLSEYRVHTYAHTRTHTHTTYFIFSATAKY